MNKLNLTEKLNPEEKEVLVIVRLTTTYWNNNKGLYQRKNINFLKRKCKGFNFIEEDCGMTGAAEVIDRIINLNKCDDGIYKVIICNERKDWESGVIDDYDYQLVKFE